MKHVSKAVLATSAFACAAMFSISWSEQAGVSLSVESAQARVGRPLTPVSVAGVARRQTRRAAYGAGVAGAAAVGTAVAVGTAAAGAPYYGGPGYYAGGPYGAYGYASPDYATRAGWVCHPGAMVKLDDGQMYRCQ